MTVNKFYKKMNEKMLYVKRQPFSSGFFMIKNDKDIAAVQNITKGRRPKGCDIYCQRHTSRTVQYQHK